MTSPGDVVCLSVASRLDPSLSFEEVARKVNNPPTDQPTYGEDFEKARKAVEAELESGRVLPTCVPGAECDLQTAYGHLVYSKYAAFTEAEFYDIFKKTPAQLSVSPWYSEFECPGRRTALYLISMMGLPMEIRLSCRKVKLYHSARTALSDQWLRTPTQ